MSKDKIKEIVEEFRKKFVKRTVSETIGSNRDSLQEEYEILNVRKPEKVIEFIESKLTTLHTELLQAVEDMKSPYRPEDKEFYNDVHRECGFRYAKDEAKSE